MRTPKIKSKKRGNYNIEIYQLLNKQYKDP